jgi:hypothetical protein
MTGETRPAGRGQILLQNFILCVEKVAQTVVLTGICVLLRGFLAGGIRYPVTNHPACSSPECKIVQLYG